jgi:hypothetical protein
MKIQPFILIYTAVYTYIQYKGQWEVVKKISLWELLPMRIIAKKYPHLGHNTCKITKGRRFSVSWEYLKTGDRIPSCLSKIYKLLLLPHRVE